MPLPLLPFLDDLEVEIVAALEAQMQQENRDIIAGHIDDSWSAASSTASTPINGQSPKEHRKLDQKKRWKNWGWKYSPGGKTSSIEEEPESPKQSTSRLASPANSPKHRSKMIGDGGSLAPSSSGSPLRRQKSPSPSSASGSGNRSSAGARLCQMIDDSQDESGDELQALLVNGRPASVHIVQLSSGKSINWVPEWVLRASAGYFSLNSKFIFKLPSRTVREMLFARDSIQINLFSNPTLLSWSKLEADWCKRVHNKYARHMVTVFNVASHWEVDLSPEDLSPVQRCQFNARAVRRIFKRCVAKTKLILYGVLSR